MARKTKKKYIVLKDEGLKEIIGQNGKYYFCKDTQYRKLNKNILKLKIERLTPPETEEKTENAEQEA